MLVSQGDMDNDIEPDFDETDKYRLTPFTALFTGKKKNRLVPTSQIATKSTRYRKGGDKFVDAFDEESDDLPKTGVHNIKFSQADGKGNNLLIERDGSTLGDLNFNGPIQNISLNENKELEISFGKVPIS
jgi:hypothetical protein